MSRTKNDIVAIYNTVKEESDGSPLLYRDFLARSTVRRGELEELFGASPYSKLQQLAGDSPTRLELTPTTLDEIMSAYGDLASELLRAEGRLPVAADWRHKRLRPTESGLSKTHGIKWSEFRHKFLDFCTANDSLAGAYKPLLNFLRENNEPAIP